MSKLNLYLISLVSWGLFLFNYIVNRNIVSTTSGFVFIIVLALIAGISFGAGLSKKD